MINYQQLILHYLVDGILGPTARSIIAFYSKAQLIIKRLILAHGSWPPLILRPELKVNSTREDGIFLCSN